MGLQPYGCVPANTRNVFLWRAGGRTPQDSALMRTAFYNGAKMKVNGSNLYEIESSSQSDGFQGLTLDTDETKIIML